VEFDPDNWTSPSGNRDPGGKRDPIIGAIHEIAGHVIPNANGTRLHGHAEEERAQKEELQFREDLRKSP
jgi:hypothetical protein